MNEQASWLADGVKEIERVVGSKVVKPELMALPQEKPGTYAIVTPSKAGEEPRIEMRMAGPLWHNERLETPEQLVRFIESMKEDRGVSAEDGAIYIAKSSIRYVFKFDDRRDRAVCPLTTSDPWNWLTSGAGPMGQRDAIRLLRITFADALTPGSNLIDVLRKIKWTNLGTVESDIQRGKEALGKQILNEAAGISNFPDEFSVTVRVFENVPFTVTVRLALDLWPEQQKIEIVPFPNQIADAMDETLKYLLQQLEQTGVPTFIGAVAGGKDASD